MSDGNAPSLSYSQLLATARAAGDALTLHVPAEWMQGRPVFGGLPAALALRAMRQHVRTPLRTLQATFLAPVPEGPVTARARVLRQGKNATHVEARIVDGEATLALLVGVFGAPRSSAVRLRPAQPRIIGGASIPFRYLPGLTPAFTQHFTGRWRKGLPPFTGDTQTQQVLDIGMRDTGAAGEAQVLALADFIAPVALSHLKSPAPGSTLTWMVEMLAAELGSLPLEGWRVDAELIAAVDGYTSQSVMLWGPGGVPVALSRQSMVIFG
jgi:hypothetical protein